MNESPMFKNKIIIEKKSVEREGIANLKKTLWICFGYSSLLQQAVCRECRVVGIEIVEANWRAAIRYSAAIIMLFRMDTNVVPKDPNPKQNTKHKTAANERTFNHRCI